MKRLIKEIVGENKTEKLQFLTMMAMIYLQYSLWMLQYNALIRLVLTIISILVLSKLTGDIVIKKNYMFMCILFVGLIVLSCAINFGIESNDIFIIVMWVGATLICSCISFDRFCIIYVRVISFLALMGTVIYIISIINCNIFLLLPDISNQTWTGGLIPKNAFFAVVDIYSNYKRAFGIFYEPGLFSFHICLALFLELFVCKKQYIIRICVLAVALIVTFSTNGYIIFVILLLAVVFSKLNAIERKNKRRILFLMIICIVIAAIYMCLNPSNWYFLIGKISENIGGLEEGSAYERLRAMKYAWNVFLENPIFGSASKNFFVYFKGVIGTFTPLNWVAIYGFFYGILCNFLFFRLSFVKKQNFISSILKIIVLFFMIITQNVSGSLIIFVIIIYNSNFAKNIH